MYITVICTNNQLYISLNTCIVIHELSQIFDIKYCFNLRKIKIKSRQNILYFLCCLLKVYEYDKCKYCKTHFLLNVAFIEKHSDIGHLNYIIIFKVYLKWVLHENIPQLTLKSMSCFHQIRFKKKTRKYSNIV